MKLGMKGPADIPEDYVAACEAMVEAARAWVREHPDARAAFRMVDKEIQLVAPVQQLAPRLCKNREALELLLTMQRACLRASGHQPTVSMVDVVLTLHGLPIERVGLGELGLAVTV
jgi:hypothetical protein